MKMGAREYLVMTNSGPNEPPAEGVVFLFPENASVSHFLPIVDGDESSKIV